MTSLCVTAHSIHDCDHSMKLKHGSFVANPPFVTSIMDASAQKMIALVEAAEAAGGALSFTIILPGW